MLIHKTMDVIPEMERDTYFPLGPPVYIIDTEFFLQQRSRKVGLDRRLLETVYRIISESSPYVHVFRYTITIIIFD